MSMKKKANDLARVAVQKGHIEAVRRLLSFGNVGRKLLTEDIARRVEIPYSLAQVIVKQIESAI